MIKLISCLWVLGTNSLIQKGSELVRAVFFKHWGFLGFVIGLIRLGDFCLVFQLLRRKWVACAVLENHWVVVPTAESSVLVLYPWFGSPNWCLWTGLKIGCCRSSHKECRFLAASSYGSIGKEKRKMVCFSLSTLAEIPKAEKLCLSTKPTFAYKRQLFFCKESWHFFSPPFGGVLVLLVFLASIGVGILSLIDHFRKWYQNMHTIPLGFRAQFGAFLF